jgi:hypothetical protein
MRRDLHLKLGEGLMPEELIRELDGARHATEWSQNQFKSIAGRNMFILTRSKSFLRVRWLN